METETIATEAKWTWKPDMSLPDNPRDFKTPNYGLTTFGDLFTPRQLGALTTFSDLVIEVAKTVKKDAIESGLVDSDQGIESGETGAQAYAEAVRVYLAFAVSKASQRNNTLCTWEAPMGRLGGAFGRQAIPMTWDYAETNPFAGAGGDIYGTVHSLSEVLDNFMQVIPGVADQADAQTQTISASKIVSTDPPYYDNIGYADLSDFFYIWLRRALKSEFPVLFSTLAVPKREELVATPYRHGGVEAAETFFMVGMTCAMQRILQYAHPAFPITIYYAFKQTDTKSEGTGSTGWETFLEAVIKAGFSIRGTWPMRTELTVALKKRVGALASSIILVCHKRTSHAVTISRREFIRELNGVLPEALDEMTKGSGDDRSPVAPVDLSQAIIGPGMAVFSKYAAVLEADGSPMSVRTALQLINRFLAEDDFDADTQFCLHWFEQHGWTESVFGEADVLARSKSTSVDGLTESGVLHSGSGKVRLLKWAEYPAEWNPQTDARTPVWEALHQLIRALKQGGESASGALLAALGGKAEAVRQLAYRLYTLCERLGQAEDARAYNELITSWTGIETAASTIAPPPAEGMLPGFEG
jgi:putative DNA methylase